MNRLLAIVIALAFAMSGCTGPASPGTPQNLTNASQPQAQPAACNDSDGGMNTSQSGAVSLGNAVFPDSCVGNSSVIEYYCIGGNTSSKEVSCADGEICLGGACSAAPAANETPAPSLCQETDSGDDIWDYGSIIFQNLTYNDTCQGIYDILEYYCENDTLAQKTIRCGSGNRCAGGECVELERSCTDSDSANDTVLGTATRYGGGGAIESKSDSCKNNATKTEYYCNGSAIANRTEACPAHTKCSGGSCVSICVDYDGGADYWSAANVLDSTGTHADYCADNYTLNEYVCSDDAAAADETDCSGACLAGRCYNSSELRCKEYGSGYEARLMAGSKIVMNATDRCEDYQSVIDYGCVSNRIEYGYSYCDSDELCYLGKCMAPAGPACYDLDSGESDRGIRIASDTVEAGNGSIRSVKTDYCLNGGTVAEFYCSGSSRAADFIECPDDERCADGACYYPYVCREGDTGEVTLSDGGTVVRAESDKCAGDSLVREVFCDSDGRMAYGLVECPSGTKCDSEIGACK